MRCNAREGEPEIGDWKEGRRAGWRRKTQEVSIKAVAEITDGRDSSCLKQTHLENASKNQHGCTPLQLL